MVAVADDNTIRQVVAEEEDAEMMDMVAKAMQATLSRRTLAGADAEAAAAAEAAND